MKNHLVARYFLALAVAAGAAAPLAAAETPPNPKPAQERPDKTNSLQRANRAREMRERFEKMTPAEREAVRKLWRARIEKRVQELRKKKADGTLSEQEARRLEQWEQRLKRWDRMGTPTQPANPQKKPTDKK